MVFIVVADIDLICSLVFFSVEDMYSIHFAVTFAASCIYTVIYLFYLLACHDFYSIHAVGKKKVPGPMDPIVIHQNSCISKAL